MAKPAKDIHLFPKGAYVRSGYDTEPVVDIAKQGGFGQLFNRIVFSGIWAHMGYSTRSVYGALVVVANHQSGYQADVGFSQLAKLAGVPRSRAQAAIDELIEKKLIRVVSHGKRLPRGNYSSNVYKLMVPMKGVVDDRPRSTRGGGGKRTAPAVEGVYRSRGIGVAAPAVDPRTAPAVEGVPPGRSLSISTEEIIDSLSEEDLAEAKAIAIAALHPDARSFLAKADPRKSPILRARIIALMRP